MLDQTGIAPGYDDLGSTSRLFDPDDHYTHPFARGVVFQPGLFAARQPAFGFSDIDDDVAALEPLDHTVDDFADVLVVFLVHTFPFGFANLLKDHLLGHLRRDSAKAIGRFLELQFVVDLRVVLQGLCFLQRNLQRVVFNGVDHFAYREHFDLPALGVEAGAEFFVGLEVLARGDNDGILNRIDNDLGVDPFLSADLVDCLKQ